MFCRQSDTVCGGNFLEVSHNNLLRYHDRMRCYEESRTAGRLCVSVYVVTYPLYMRSIHFIIHWLINITKVESDGWLGKENN